MVDDTPTFDDEPFGDDESFTDDSMGADEDMPQMDMEDEDYSDLFDGDQEESESTGKKKKKKKKDKKKKGAKAGGKSPLKRILILVLLLLVLGGGGFAAYTFFLAEEPTTKVTVKRRPATRQQAPKLDDEIPADLLKDIEQEEAAMKKAEKIEPVKAVIPETKKTVEKRQTTKTTVRKKTRTKQEPIKAAVSVATGAYYVQFGAFGSSANAARMEKRLKKAGMDTLIKQKATRAGKTINYVLLNEPYKSSKEASQTASQIKRTTGYDTAVFRNR
jgi:cell division septation protein DedD